MKLPKLPAFRLPLLATSCLIILLFVSCFVPFSRPTPITHLSENDKKELADFADAVLVAETENKSQPKIPLMAYFRSFDYDRAYVTIYLDNQLIGCMAGIAASTSRAKLYKDVGSATIRALHDKRFQAKIKAEDLLRLRLIISFLYDQKPLTQGNLKDFQEKIKLGVHSISLASGQKKATYLADVPIKHNWDHRTTLENLCQKAKLPKSCYLQKQTKIKIFQTLVFERNQNGQITTLYRGNPLVQTLQITQTVLKESVENGFKRSLLHLNPQTGTVKYLYLPSLDRYQEENQSEVRNLASLWTLAETQNFLNKSEATDTLQKSLKYYSRFIIDKGNRAYLSIRKQSNLAFGAFYLLTLLETDSPDLKLVKKLANGLVTSQRQDGSYQTDLGKKPAEPDHGLDYYPGEAMLALMKTYQKTGEARYLASVRKAFPFYRRYWLENKNTAFVPWHSQADFLLYQATKDPKVTDFVFQMNDWLIQKQVLSSPYYDEVGGFTNNAKQTTFSSAVFLEGLTDAYRLAKERNDQERIRQYEKSLREGIRFVLQLQVSPTTAANFKNPSFVSGGFRQSLVRNNQRNDYTQHSLRALMKTSSLGIFGN